MASELSAWLLNLRFDAEEIRHVLRHANSLDDLALARHHELADLVKSSVIAERLAS